MTPRRFLCLCVALLLAGCAVSAPRNREASAPAAQPRPFANPDQEITYHVFMGELAGGRGDVRNAVNEYMAAARLSPDPTLAAHAALLAYGDADLQGALEMARRWKALAPDSADAVHLAAVTEARQGDAAGAARDFGALLQSHQDDSPMAAAHLLEQETDAEHALPVLQAMVAAAPQSSQAHFALAHAALEFKRNALAEQEARAALALDPHAQEPLVLMARAMVAEGKADEALSLLKTRAHSGGDLSLQLAYGALLVEAKRDQDARDQFEAVLKQHPDNADALYTLGLMALERKDMAAARGYFGQLLKTGTHRDDANYFLGSIAEGEKLYPEALDWYHRVQDGERWLAAQAGIGRSLIKGGSSAAAAEFFDGLVANDPEAAVSLRLAEGQVFSDAGDTRRALEVYDSALGDAPEDEDLLYARALVLEQGGNADGAEHDLATILKRAPDNAEALNALGYTLTLHTTRYREAKGYIQRALTLQPADPAFMDSMGWVEYRLGNTAVALDYLQKAYAALADPEVAAHLVEVLLASGDAAQARELWLKANAADPENPALRALAPRFAQ